MDIIKPARGRIWGIDFLRGIAVIMMIIFHILYDINYFAGYPFALHSGFWWLFARLTAGIFIFLVGISLALSYSRIKAKLSGKEVSKKYIKRGIKIFCWGMLITGLTWLFLSGIGTIWFGVLHLIGISIILAIPFLRFKSLNLFLGLILLLLGFYLRTMVFSFPWLLPLGLLPAGFYSLDYLPILPWFGLVLIGIFAGNSLISKKLINPSKPPKYASPISLIGRHSLLVYLLHQPILIGLIYLLIY